MNFAVLVNNYAIGPGKLLDDECGAGADFVEDDYHVANAFGADAGGIWEVAGEERAVDLPVGGEGWSVEYSRGWEDEGGGVEGGGRAGGAAAVGGDGVDRVVGCWFLVAS